jgi:glycosyltransferase involved in cell wall biosynthesis
VASGEASGWRIPVKRWVERSVYRRAVVVVVLSEAFKRLLVRDYGVPPWAIEVIPPGVDLARLDRALRSDPYKCVGVGPRSSATAEDERLHGCLP